MDAATVPASFVRQDERGTFVEVINRGPWETVITGRMKPGAVMGNHYHKLTDIFFCVTEGGCRIDLECVRTGKRRQVRVPAGRGVFLQPYESHAIRFETESTFVLLKSRPYDPDDPDTYEHPVGQSLEESASSGTG